MNESTIRWECALDNMQKRIEGKMKVGMMLIDKFFPLSNRDFEVTRATGHDHLYHVVRNDDKKWFQCKYELGCLVFICGNLDYEI